VTHYIAKVTLFRELVVEAPEWFTAQANPGNEDADTDRVSAEELDFQAQVNVVRAFAISLAERSELEVKVNEVLAAAAAGP